MKNYKRRRGITIYVDRKVWNAFDKFIEPSGVSPSRMLEAIMRVAVDPQVARIWERINYAILKAVGEVGKSGARKEKRKKLGLSDKQHPLYLLGLPRVPSGLRKSSKIRLNLCMGSER